MPVLVPERASASFEGEDRTDWPCHIGDQRLEVLAIGRLRAGLTESAIEDSDLLGGLQPRACALLTRLYWRSGAPPG